jgi:DNA-binding GntR family transcriptional regulator
MVEVNARRGWFVVQPSRDDARDAFRARQAIETGMLQSLGGRLERASLKRLKLHIAQEKAAVAGIDAGERSFLLGDFHVCLAECAGNTMLADILRDLTARTTLIATLYQSNHEAAVSCEEHAHIVTALERGDNTRAAALMRAHIDSVADHLNPQARDDPLGPLRAALAPIAKPAAPPEPVAQPKPAQALHTSPPIRLASRSRRKTA